MGRDSDSTHRGVVACPRQVSADESSMREIFHAVGRWILNVYEWGWIVGLGIFAVCAGIAILALSSLGMSGLLNDRERHELDAEEREHLRGRK